MEIIAASDALSARSQNDLARRQRLAFSGCAATRPAGLGIDRDLNAGLRRLRLGRPALALALPEPDAQREP